MQRTWGFTFILFFCLCCIHHSINGQCSISIEIPDDLTICEPTSVNLDGIVNGPFIATTWEGTNGFYSEDQNTTDITGATTTYTFTAYAATTTNLVINGDFEDGNQGFTSDYELGEILCGPNNQWGILGCEGAYTINTNPINTHTNFADCGDHTTGSGQMIIVNGSSSPVNVWCQDISVTPNTDYLFSAWAMSVVSGSPADLQFEINGQLIGTVFDLTSTTCVWENFTADWNSGSNSTATICISNLNTAVGGNDFAMDDIEFLEVCKVEESFTVEIGELQGTIATSHFIDCDNPVANLQVIPPNPNHMYDWTTLFGGTIAGPTDQSSAFATTPGLYKVIISDANGCTKELTTTVNGSTQQPQTTIVGEFEITCENNMVTVFSTNTQSGNIYNWIGSANNSTTTSAIYDEAGTFLLELTNSFNCTEFFFFDISEIITDPDYQLDPGDILSCIGDSTVISFSTQDTPDNFTWFDPQGEMISSDNNITVNDIGFYTVLIEYDNGCTFIDSVEVTSQISQLDYILGESPVITCSDTISTLHVDINSAYSLITWTQDTLIGSDQSVNVSNTGLYILEITDNNGCITRDSVTVNALNYIPTYNIDITEIDCVSGIGSLVLSTDSIYTIEWIDENGNLSSGDSISSSVAGEYIVQVENSIGCISTDTLSLIANQKFPIITTESQDLNCTSPDGIITVESSINNTMYSWEGPNGFNSALDSFSVTVPGNYIFTATTEDGCVTQDSIDIDSDFIEPDITLFTLDTISCNQNEINISISSNGVFDIVDIQSNNIISEGDSTVTVGEAGIVSITIQSENGCESTQDITLAENFSSPPIIDQGTFQLNCNTLDSIITVPTTLTQSTFWIYENDTISFESETTIASFGSYSIVQIHAETGCETTTVFDVTEDFSAPDFGIEYNDINCIESLAAITLTTDNPATSIVNLNGADDIDGYHYNTEEAGNYTFIVYYENGCSAEAAIDISIDTISPIISAEDKAFTCVKEPLALTVDHNIDNPSFEWSGPQGSNSTEDFLITAFTGTYFVTVTNEDNGCSSITDIVVNNDTTLFDTTLDVFQPSCFGDIGSAGFINVTGGTMPYDIVVWDENNIEVDANNLPAGSYEIHLTDLFGCDTTESFVIEETFPFSVNTNNSAVIILGADTEIIATTDLDSTLIDEIEWTPSNFLSCTDCLNPLVENLTEDTWFTVSITDINGCAETDSILIRVIIDYLFYVPNTFTPNGDGINDIFFINANAFAAESVISEFVIFDRWGNNVHRATNFFPNDIQAGWNGTHNSKKVQTGVYAYYVLALLPDGTTKELIGDITLTR